MTDPGSNAPVWWDKEVDAAGRPIRLDVRTAAHQIWDAARRQAQHLLGDASEAPELMENSADVLLTRLATTEMLPFPTTIASM